MALKNMNLAPSWTVDKHGNYHNPVYGPGPEIPHMMIGPGYLPPPIVIGPGCCRPERKVLSKEELEEARERIGQLYQKQEIRSQIAGLIGKLIEENLANSKP